MIDEHTITAEVLDRQKSPANARLATVMAALITHLHAFAREVALTEDEWQRAIEFLTDTGHITTDERQEFILLSDVLGLSMLVTSMNHKKPDGCTEATVFGPFHRADAPPFALGDDIANGAPGEPCFVNGSVRGTDGTGVSNATLEVWQADSAGLYDVQHGDHQHRARGILRSAADGRFHFKSILAEPYPIPADGPVGRLLEGLGRHPWRPAHLHFRISTPGYQTLVTHVFRAGGTYLDGDAVFGVRQSLIADWIRHPPGPTPDGAHSDVAFYTLHFDFVLAHQDNG